MKVKDWNKFAYLCSVLNILNETQFRFETTVSLSFPFFMSSQFRDLWLELVKDTCYDFVMVGGLRVVLV